VVNDLRLAPSTVEAANRLRPTLLKLARELRREVHSLGVTGGQVSLLATIRQNPGIGVRELAALERMSAPGMSKYVTRLERAGLVTRTRGEDRRRISLALTPQAERVLRSVKERRTAWLASGLKQLDADELVKIEDAIEPLARLLEVRS
jgi:DNA-binding MarR family transcriptional regulator